MSLVAQVSAATPGKVPHVASLMRATMHVKSSSALVARDLRGQHVARRLDIDQRIDVKFGRYDIGPFVQDAVKLVVAFDIEHGGRAAADARIDMLADTRSLVSADPGPEALPLRGDFGWAFGARRRDDEKQGGHDEYSAGLNGGVRWAKSLLHRAHHLGCAHNGGHASLCPPHTTNRLHAGTMALPIGQSAMPASFRCAHAKGMPMIVIAISTAVMRWPSASHQPARMSQIRLPMPPSGPVPTSSWPVI